jgi:O-antigen/teichoic acid export membrane protein
MDSARAEHINATLPPPEDSAPASYPPEQGAPPSGPPSGATPLDYETPPGANNTLKKAALRSSMWTLTAFVLAQFIRFASVYFLQWFLLPDDFGVANTVGFFIVLLAALSDVGIEQAIIQNKRGDDPSFLNTAWTVHVLRGVLLWVGACALAYPVYRFYQGKEDARYLLVMLPVAGLAPLVAGFNSTAVFTLHRHMRQGWVTVFALAYQIVLVLVTVAIAWKWRSPWAMIIGGIAANFCYMVASHFLIPGYRNRFCWDKQVRSELMKFGKWIMISTLITYLALQIDRVMIPKLLDFHWAGLYGIAITLVSMPREVIGRLASVSLFPLLSRAAEGNPGGVQRVLVRARGLILTAALALSLGVILVGPVFVKFFFKQEFHLAGWLTQLASIGGWFILLQATADRALLAQGRTKPLALSNAVNLTVTVIAALAGRWIDMTLLKNPYGITGFMLGLAAGKLAGHVMIQFEMRRGGMPIIRQDALYTLALLVLSIVGIALPGRLPGFRGNEMIYQAAVAAVLCTLTCAWAGWKVLRGIR